MKKLLLISSFLVYLNAYQDKLESRTDLSIVKTAGNSDSTTFSAKTKIEQTVNIDKYILKSSFLYAKDGNKEKSNRSNINGRWDREIIEKLFGFAESKYILDKFSGYDYRLNIGPGVGFNLINENEQLLDLLISLPYSQDKYKIPSIKENYIGYKTELDYEYKIYDNVKFKQNADFLQSIKESSKYFISSESGFEIKINDMLALGISFKYDYQNQVLLQSINKRDTTYLTSLIITY
ncbi:MAG: DUF481 domain-containing protein [Campylobacterales bacterium]|nr:DUF481 domain-containing protein [Campylobacterales bacterium]